MHHPADHALLLGPYWSLSRWSDLHPGTSFTCVSLVPFGVWRYCAGTRYGSPDSPAICLWSSSSLLLWVPELCSSTGSLLDYRNTWITHPPPPGHGGTSGIFSGYPSSPMHPLPMQPFYFCSNLGRVPTPGWGSPRDSPPHQLCGSWADIPQFPLISPHRSGGNTRVVSILPPCFSLRSPPCSTGVGRQEPLSPAVTSRWACLFLLQQGNCLHLPGSWW